jgi:hypothetical protein
MLLKCLCVGATNSPATSMEFVTVIAALISSYEGYHTKEALLVNDTSLSIGWCRHLVISKELGGCQKYFFFFGQSVLWVPFLSFGCFGIGGGRRLLLPHISQVIEERIEMMFGRLNIIETADLALVPVFLVSVVSYLHVAVSEFKFCRSGLQNFHIARCAPTSFTNLS